LAEYYEGSASGEQLDEAAAWRHQHGNAGILAKLGEDGGNLTFDAAPISGAGPPELVFATHLDFPVTGDSGRLYIATDENAVYRWEGPLYRRVGLGFETGNTIIFDGGIING
jgi:hypothetical protein